MNENFDTERMPEKLGMSVDELNNSLMEDIMAVAMDTLSPPLETAVNRQVSLTVTAHKGNRRLSAGEMAAATVETIIGTACMNNDELEQAFAQNDYDSSPGIIINHFLRENPGLRVLITQTPELMLIERQLRDTGVKVFTILPTEKGADCSFFEVLYPDRTIKTMASNLPPVDLIIAEGYISKNRSAVYSSTGAARLVREACWTSCSANGEEPFRMSFVRQVSEETVISENDFMMNGNFIMVTA